jgi:broad specificity phosphatase PhoE
MNIIFEAHGTTFDNEAHLSSGHFDVELSPLGERQAKELGERYREVAIDAVFCSDLQRSFRTAEIAFADSNIEIIRDSRLRECDYGEMTRKSSDLVDKEKVDRISTPFPAGESYEQAIGRISAWLFEVAEEYADKTIMVIGHRATQYGLEHLVNGVSISDAVVAPWRWQPGWRYTFKPR